MTLQLIGSGVQADAQTASEGWNGSRAIELIQRASVRRSDWTGVGELRDYRARASGHIYFLYDLGRGSDRHLVKADQLALDLYWQAPDRSRQVIIGRREKKALPTDIRYHLDHLTIVMDNLGDRISLGEGSEVRDALHPAAPSAGAFYDYRLADSLTLLLPEREIRVYKLEFRPRDPKAPGLIGALFLDRTTADIVRLEFTFTAASYRDETLDYFNVRLENALWDGRYWLPHRQGIELRREVQALRFPAGGIIRAEFRISDYRFNTDLPDAFFRGPRVASLPAVRLGQFEFESGLYDALDPAVAVAPPSLEAIRQEATQMVAESYLTPIRGARLAVEGASSVLRFRRSEGLYVGPGVTHDFPGAVSATLLGGYAIGADRGQLQGRLQVPLAAGWELELGGYWNRAADVSAWPASSGVIATLAALIVGEDYREPYWTSGATAGLRRDLAGGEAAATIAVEDWKSAELGATAFLDRSYRGVRALDEGRVASLAVQFRKPPRLAVETVGGTSWEARIEAASGGIASDFEFVRAWARAQQVWPALAAEVNVSLSGSLGAVAGGRLPAQRLFPVGGRGTVRGYSFHRHVGNLYAGAGLELVRAVSEPLLSLAVFADLGWVGLEGEAVGRAVDVWNGSGRVAGAARGPLIGVGAGVGLLFDILRVELARGLTQDGLWELVVRVRPEFWSWL